MGPWCDEPASECGSLDAPSSFLSSIQQIEWILGLQARQRVRIAEMLLVILKNQ